MLWLLGCKTGSFGFDCNETCGHCNEVNQCSKIDGICYTGCKAGFQGDLCRSSSYFWWFLWKTHYKNILCSQTYRNSKRKI